MLEPNVMRRRRCTVMHVTILNYPSHDTETAGLFSRRLSEAVIARVTNYDGIVDILTPSSILASFNCHTPCYVRHPKMACQCALGVASDLQQYPDMSISITIDTGDNLGGSCGVANVKRAEVVSGESVDLTLKMSALAHRLGCCVLITETVQKETLDQFDVQPVDTIEPYWLQPNRLSQVTLYELRTWRRHNKANSGHVFTQAFSFFRQGRLGEARSLFSLFCDSNDEETQGRRLRAMCNEYHDRGFPCVPYVRRELQWEVFDGEQAVLEQVQREGWGAGDAGLDDGSVTTASAIASSTSAAVPASTPRASPGGVQPLPVSTFL